MPAIALGEVQEAAYSPGFNAGLRTIARSPAKVHAPDPKCVSPQRTKEEVLSDMAEKKTKRKAKKAKKRAEARVAERPASAAPARRRVVSYGSAPPTKHVVSSSERPKSAQPRLAPARHGRREAAAEEEATFKARDFPDATYDPVVRKKKAGWLQARGAMHPDARPTQDVVGRLRTRLAQGRAVALKEFERFFAEQAERETVASGVSPFKLRE